LDPITAGAGGRSSGTGGNAAGSSSAGSSGSAGSAGSGGAHAGSTLLDCKNEDLGPCGTFTTQAGVKIQLGPDGALSERNVGKGFEVPLARGDADDGTTCKDVVASFGESSESSGPLLDTGDIDFKLYTIYRPATWTEGKKYPVITWGNGTCAKPEGYGALLRYVASHGFVVIAANSRWTGSNSPMLKALDFAAAANADPSSTYYKRLDLTKIGAMGHSQGSAATISAAQDPRVKAVILWNGGSSADKPYLAITGEMDINNPTVFGLTLALTGNPPGGYIFYHKVVGTGPVRGHLTLMTQPERVVEPAVAWFKYQLLNDLESRKWFVGTTCELCDKDEEFEYGQRGLL
jgi:hypothetical protein